MRRFWPISVLLLSFATGAFAQDLGGLAEQEKARRRKQSEPAKVFTNDDLPQHAPAPSPSPSPSAAPPPGPTRAGRVRARTVPIAPAPGQQAQPARPEVEEPSDTQEQPAAPAADQEGAESYWRSRAQDLRDAISAAEKRLADAQTAYDRARKGVGQPLPIDALSQITPNPMLKTGEQLGSENELNAARAELARAQTAFADFEEEARRKGALPGWLR